MNFCGWQIDPAAQAAIFGFALTLASEVIGMSKLRENSLLQLALGLARRQLTSRVNNRDLITRFFILLDLDSDKKRRFTPR